MASTFHDLLAAVMKYPEAIYAVKPYDNLNTEDSAKNVFDRLVAYKPTSLMNNIPRVVSNLPEEFLVLQNKTTNPEGIDSLSSLTNRPWVQTDSATDIIDVIRSKYAKSKGVDQFVGVHLTASYDTGTLYKHDGTILKGKLKDQQDIIGFGEKVSTTGNKEIGNFTDGQLNGQGKQILPALIL